MGLVAHPGAPVLEARARVQIVGGMDELCGGRPIRLLPPARWVTPTIVLLEPDAAQHLDRRSVPDFGRGIGGIRGL
jgi:hypothetical protein